MKTLRKTIHPRDKMKIHIDNELERIQASFRLEGQNLSSEILKHCRLIIENKVSVEDAVAQVIRDR